MKKFDIDNEKSLKGIVERQSALFQKGTGGKNLFESSKQIMKKFDIDNEKSLRGIVERQSALFQKGTGGENLLFQLCGKMDFT